MIIEYFLELFVCSLCVLGSVYCWYFIFDLPRYHQTRINQEIRAEKFNDKNMDLLCMKIKSEQNKINQ